VGPRYRPWASLGGGRHCLQRCTAYEETALCSIGMPASFVVYIDESGDEGFSFRPGCSSWFILSAVITRKATDLETVKLIDRVRQLLGKPENKPLHFRDLKHEQRLPLINEIASADLGASTIFIQKHSLNEPEKFQERYRLYFYTVRILLERVSWYCRDRRLTTNAGDGTAEIIFSNRSGMSYAEIIGYFNYLKSQSVQRDVRIHWPVIELGRITAFSPNKRMGLQIADAVASGFFYAMEQSRYGFTEDRYARLLKPVVYQRNGRFLGYGLKFWPEATPEIGWLEEYSGSGAQEPTR
jgi:hypothetical protein